MAGCEMGCFGKLPIHQDFIQMNAAVPELEQLDQWFQRGIHQAKRSGEISWPEDFEKATSWEFVFQPERTRRYLVGLCVPSRDEGGRHYPFFVFLVVDRSQSALPTTVAPMALVMFLREARLLVEACWADMNLQLLRDRIDQMAAVNWTDVGQRQEAYQHFLRNKTAHKFWTELFGEFELSKKYLLYWN